MKFARLSGGVVALCAFVAVALVYARVPARSFDLQGSPVTVKRPAADITDTYLFPSPSNPNNIVAVMDVYPLIEQSSSPSLAYKALNTFFDQGVLYTFKFDNNYTAQATNGGRPVEDLVLQVSFGAPSGGTQQVFAYGLLAPTRTGPATGLVDGGSPTGSGFINKAFSLASPSDNIHVFAGARRDPAFLNATATATGSSTYPYYHVSSTPGTYFGIFPTQNPNTTTGTSCITAGTCAAGFTAGTDLFGATDVLSIVVELPKVDVTGSSGIVAFWATTSTTTGN
ncbi:MAG: DUF4331 family protein [Candidatus Eremiobacteraeota bacterium]|nr:DUF4331 family protein [Candidatus Eremiobacteraeota bacterium]